jgi:holo-[acyl-carrier protein] synthase
MILGIGTDLVFCPRFEKIYNRTGYKFFERIFTEKERERCDARLKRFESYGKVFAAKEAYLKAAGNNRDVRWKDIEILHNDLGKPYIHLTGAALDRLEELLPSGYKAKIELSITDEPPYAQAFVVLWCTLA